MDRMQWPVALLTGLLLAACSAPTPPKTLVHSPRHTAYVWQQHWTPAVGEAIMDSTEAMDSYMVLAAEFERAEGRPPWRMPGVDWARLANAGRPIWLVLRANQLPGLDSPEGRAEIVDAFGGVLSPLRHALQSAGGEFAGFQLDYDSATEDLPHYAALTRAFREATPDAAWSITTLPAWLGRPAFADLVDGLDHFVLQVHAFDPPRHRGDPITLCDPTRVPRWLAQADALGVPFYTALPTYGYRLRFDASGEFAGLQAEGSVAPLAPRHTRDLMADPGEIAGLVREIEGNLPENCLGFAWFRLPVEGDQLNWSWPLLARVMQGQAPVVSLHAEGRAPEPGLVELWIENRGLHRPSQPIRVTVDWIQDAPIAHDAIGGYRLEPRPGENGHTLTGPAPPAGEAVMAAWFRLADEADTSRQTLVSVGEVEILP